MVEMTEADAAALRELQRIYAIIERKQVECREAGNLPGFGVCMELLKELGQSAVAIRDKVRNA